ncbi:MAG: hypothetical protein NT154_19805, partial [Verrucomicrobia bacterium]|nr:hypothetical protein [Verrucomicrobiota bacterium]
MANPARTLQKVPVDALRQVRQHGIAMAESEKQFSVTAQRQVQARGPQSKFLSVGANYEDIPSPNGTTRSGVRCLLKPPPFAHPSVRRRLRLAIFALVFLIANTLVPSSSAQTNTNQPPSNTNQPPTVFPQLQNGIASQPLTMNAEAYIIVPPNQGSLKIEIVYAS